MLTEIADGVLVRRSAFCLSNAIVVRNGRDVLLVDPGVAGTDLTELVDDLDRLGAVAVAGFATHPHWDHLLWHSRFGDVPRYATTRCAAVATEGLPRIRDMVAGSVPDAPLDQVGQVTALPPGSAHVPWDGPAVRVVEHQAHAPGHAALVIEDARVLLAGDMLSDVEIPLFDPDAADPAGAYGAGLELLAGACAAGIDTVVPGHGSVATGDEIRARIESDRAYVRSLRDGADPADARIGPQATYGTDWLGESHERNVRLTQQHR